jgi:hypothetical protein
MRGQDTENAQDSHAGHEKASGSDAPYRFSFMGLGSSGFHDTAARVEEILKDEWTRVADRRDRE